ncbi:5-(carboxyamino)imidazole ribonucleotide synthase [Microbacterium halotolerans]|uniref:5-(carboxyamino)imidazole ribonucleotide synthase n=1 Tax=Microbacterium halotolerans TaxID=246613 RepID=UPI000E6AD772|nr:5-(carboxyamino)imidazole ribonucleotide synthase [Microbacterium halotolerans]
MSLRVGVIGGGQLARMMIAPAVELGVELRVLAEADGMSAALAATAVGDYRDPDVVLAFAKDVDVITFDHEHVPQPVLRALVDAGVKVHPGPDALRYAQDKIVMRTRLAEVGTPQPDWAAVRDAGELQAFLDGHSGRAVVKTPRGGYDGKGVRGVSSGSEADDWFADFDGEPILVEELVDFRRELAQQIARRPSGATRAYPVVETVQRDGICSEVFAPAPGASARTVEASAQIAEEIAAGLGVTGMLAVELFETTDGRVLVNELAMRPHNSGHWTQDGAVTSQFEQHLRAVLDLPLGDTAPVSEAAVMINILGGPEGEELTDRIAVAAAEHPTAKIHTYGKAPRPGRKVGHVNAFGDDLDDAAHVARAAAALFG